MSQPQNPSAAGSALASIISVSGSQATVGLPSASVDASERRATVGKFLAIQSGTALLIGMVTEVSIETPIIARELGFVATAKLDLMGEIRSSVEGGRAFQRGVTEYPAIGDPANLLSGADLRLVYDMSGADSIDLGQLQQDPAVKAHINVNEMLCKHFAVLGTTGVGKSSGVALILQMVLERRPDLRILLLDGHNEYGRCFGDRAQVLNPRNLKLPFWLFNFEETVDVIFGGRPGLEDEVEILADVIVGAKSNYTQYKNSNDRTTLKRLDARSTGYTVDTPVPYRLQDLVALIDERMGKLENRSSRMHYHRLITRIETVRNDPRYAFMFDNANVGGDTMGDVLRQLFRIPPSGKPMTVMQLAGFPAEVVDSVVSVLGRMAFEFGLWSDGAVPILFVCEEAHRYASADRSIGFGPTRKAISRIAKEGRKYGVFLGLVTQRPAELDATIISQCSTLFVMRMANDRDQALVRSAVSDAAANLLSFVPSLGTREVLAFGEGVALPTRLKFSQVPEHLLPRSEAVANGNGVANSSNPDFIDTVIDRWRGAMMSQKQRLDEGPSEFREETPPLAPAGLDPDRFKLLKKPLEPSADAFGAGARESLLRR